MYSNIVVPVSFDEERDLDKAIEVAKILSSSGARITFVHVVESIPNYVADMIPEQSIRDRDAELNRLLSELAARTENANGVLLHGNTGRSITGWAQENKADCIVIASHRPVISDLLIGSTAAWVVRHADCAVHVVR